MITSFFVLSPRGDTILSKMYRTRPEINAHERSHTEAFFRKIKFWNEMNNSNNGGVELGGESSVVNESKQNHKKADPPPVFLMPDGQSYFHVNRNGLVFACSTERNISPCAVVEVSIFGWESGVSSPECRWNGGKDFKHNSLNLTFFVYAFARSYIFNTNFFFALDLNKASIQDCESI